MATRSSTVAHGASSAQPGTGKSHLAQALSVAVIQQGHRVLYREAHRLVDEPTDAQLAGTRKTTLAHFTTVPLLIVDDFGMRKLPPIAAEDPPGNRHAPLRAGLDAAHLESPAGGLGLLGDTGAVTALLDRLLHYAARPHVRPAQLAPAPPRRAGYLWAS